MLENSVVSRVVELFDSTCISQFESMGCAVHKVDKPSAWPGLLSAHIDAVSKDLSVELLLIAPSPLLAQTMPSGDGYSVADPDLQKDWLLELANRFVGRLKNKLVEHGSVLKIGFPVANDTENDKKVFIKNVQGDEIVRCFEVAGDVAADVIECRLYISLHNEALELLDHEDEDEDWFSESELQDF